MHTLAAIAVVFLFVGGVLLWLVDDRVMLRLRGSHPEVWQALGTPSNVFDDWGMAYTRAVEELYRRPELWSQCDAEIVKLAAFAHKYHRIYGVISVIAFVALAFAVWKIT